MHQLSTCFYQLASLSIAIAIVAIAIAITITSTSQCLAAGYGINENSASYMATGFAGRASNPVDASIAANNPAGISFIPAYIFSAGSAVILKGGEFEGQFTRPPRFGGLVSGETISGKTTDF